MNFTVCTQNLKQKRASFGDSMTFFNWHHIKPTFQFISPESLVIKHTIFAVCFPAPNGRKYIDFGDLFANAASMPNFGDSEVVTQSSTHGNADCERNWVDL